MPRLRGLPFQLLALLVLPLFVLVVLVAFGGVALHQSAMREMVASHNLHAVEGIASALAAQLDLRSQALERLDTRLDRGESPGTVLEAAERWGSLLFDGGIAIVDDGGISAASGGIAADLPPEFFTALAAAPNSGSFFYPLYDVPFAGMHVAVAQPSGDAQWVVGIVSLDGLGVPGLVENLHPNTTTSLVLIASDGRALYHSETDRTGEIIQLPEQAASALNGGARSTTQRAAGEELIVTYVPVQEAGWALVQEERWRESLALLTRYSQAAPLVLVPGLLVAAGAVWFGIRRIVWPLQQLEMRASELAWGNFDAIGEPVGGIDEIAHLQATLQLMAKRVQAAQVGMRSYIGAITRGQEEERLRLAHELHDQTAQSLVAIGHREQKLKRYLTDSPEGDAVLADLRAMTARAVDELRRIIRGMRPIYLEELGLVPALEMLTRDLQQEEEGLDIAFSQTGGSERLPPDDEIALYRIAQEALNNAQQHSGASRLELSIHFGADEVELAVQDNGRGFTAPHRVTDLSEQGHFGLMGMYERAALIGAQLQVHSEPGEGTRVVVRRPLRLPSDEVRSNL